jgi:Ca2+-binding EF-hand superfamily protein
MLMHIYLALPHLARSDLLVAWQEMDLNHDGTITLEELKAYNAQQQLDETDSSTSESSESTDSDEEAEEQAMQARAQLWRYLHLPLMPS